MAADDVQKPDETSVAQLPVAASERHTGNDSDARQKAVELIAARKRSRARSTSTATKHGVLLDDAADFAADKEEPQEQEERGVTAAPQEAAAADAAAKAQKEKAKEEARRFRARATAGLQHLELREEVGGSTAQKSGSATVDVDAAVAELEGLSYMKLKNELVRRGVPEDKVASSLYPHSDSRHVPMRGCL